MGTSLSISYEAWLALILAIVSAGAAAWAWLLGRMDRIADRSRDDRHRLANEVQVALGDVEDRLAARIAALEARYTQQRR